MWCTNAYTVIACIDMRNRYTWIQRYLCYLGIDIHGYNDIYATLVLDMHETYNVMFMIFTWPSYCHALVYRWYIHLVNVCIPRYNTPGIYVDFYFAYIYTTIYPTLCRNPQKWRAHTPTSSGSAITHRSPLFTGCHLVWPPSPPLLGCVTVSHTSLCLCLVLAIVLVGIAALWLLVYGCTSAHNTTQDVRWSSWDLYFTPTLCRNPQHLGTQGPLDSAALEKCSHDASMNFGGSKLRTIALGLWTVFVHAQSCSWSIFADFGVPWASKYSHTANIVFVGLQVGIYRSGGQRPWHTQIILLNTRFRGLGTAFAHAKLCCSLPWC